MSNTTAELKQITYGLTRADRAPVANEYLVTIGQQGRVNSVYCIATVRPVKHRDPATDQQHYVLGVKPAQEAKPLTEYDKETGEVWVQGVEAHGLVWYSRDKKHVAQLPARIKLRRQPVGSNLCGHCCVAMVASRSTSKVLELFGFDGPTRPAHLVHVLGQLGFSPAPRLVAFRHQAALPSCCLLKLAWPGQRRYHWVVYHNGQVYDPSYGQYAYEQAAVRTKRGRFTSFLRLV